MARNWDGAILAQAASGKITLALLAQLAFDDGTLYVTSLPYDVTWNGNLYQGLGALGGLQPVEETIELKAANFVASLSGVPASSVGLALNEQVQGRAATILVACFDDGWRIIGDPAQNVLVRGRMDVMKIKISADGATATVEISIRNQLAAWDTPNIARYSDDEQQAIFPGDAFFEFVPQMGEKEIVWG